jgi:hypothetical protein
MFSLRRPKQCVSLITEQRTYDFYFENQDDLINFHIMVECMIPIQVKKGKPTTLLSLFKRKSNKKKVQPDNSIQAKDVKAPSMIKFRLMKEAVSMIA